MTWNGKEGHQPIQKGHQLIQKGHIPLNFSLSPLTDKRTSYIEWKGHQPIEKGHQTIQKGHTVHFVERQINWRNL